ncbi:MAG: hypothetical protein MUO78_07540 [candidate division Zixibacteria bacterium]|nr:hypothetical protein [candidate division Zixibacteria bacterium]
MLKKNQAILGLLIIVIFIGITAVAILERASGGGGTPIGQISGEVTYPVPYWPPGDDWVDLYDSAGYNRIDSVAIQGGGGKHWYNMLVPPHTGYYVVVGRGENCCSEGYYVYWEEEDNLGQNIVMDQPNTPNK